MATLANSLLLLIAALTPLPASAQAAPSQTEPPSGHTDWLVVTSEPGRSLAPSAITPSQDPLFWGDLVEVDIVLTNDTEHDRLLDVTATLGIAAFFADASRGGQLVAPEQAPETRDVVWRQLSLPAHSSGLLEMTLVLRPEQDAGDLSVDVEASDRFSGEVERLNLHRPLSYDPAESYGPTSPALYAIYFIIFATIVSLLLLAVTRFALPKDHRVRRVAGRVAAFFGGAFLLGVVGFGLIRGVLDSYAGATETSCLVLDRRANPEVGQSTGSGSNRQHREYQRPLIAAEYESRHGRQIAVGFGSDIVSPGMDALADYQIGDEVTCWYENDSPDRFFVVRGYDFGALMIFLFVTLASLVLFYVALKR